LFFFPNFILVGKLVIEKMEYYLQIEVTIIAIYVSAFPIKIISSDVAN
jgi:hypothetical protein